MHDMALLAVSFTSCTSCKAVSFGAAMVQHTSKHGHASVRGRASFKTGCAQVAVVLDEASVL